MSNYRGPGLYQHYKGGYYDVFELALWEPMAGKDDGDTDLSDKLVDFARDFDAFDWDMVSGSHIEEVRAMLLRAAELLSTRTLVIYEPLTEGSLLEGMEGVRFWARGKEDFDGDGSVPDAKGIAMTVPRFIFQTGPKDPEIRVDEVKRLKRVIRQAHNDLNDPNAIEAVKADLSNAILSHRIGPDEPA